MAKVSNVIEAWKRTVPDCDVFLPLSLLSGKSWHLPTKRRKKSIFVAREENPDYFCFVKTFKS